MGVYIKGMELPTTNDGGFINVRIFADGTVYTRTWPSGYVTYQSIEVPEPHGRLIDADNGIDNDVKDYEFNGKYSGCTIQDMLDCAPTIIEAEEQEHE